jgi:hypothetical protein
VLTAHYPVQLLVRAHLPTFGRQGAQLRYVRGLFLRTDIMTISRTVLLVLVCGLLNVAFAQDNLLVISQTAIGEFQRNPSEKTSFYPSEIVKLLQERNGKVLVQRIDQQASWEVKTEAENQAAMAPAWIEKNRVVSSADFVPLNQWKGEDVFSWCDGSCDGGVAYWFMTNGTFKAKDDDRETKPVVWKGRLYKHGKVIWAKPNGKRGISSRYSMFYLKDDGKLCTYVECFGSL